MAKKKNKPTFVYTVWLDWKRPIIGFSYPPIGQVEPEYEVNGVTCKRIASHCWALVGNLDDGSVRELVPYEWPDRPSAQSIASLVGGYVNSVMRPM